MNYKFDDKYTGYWVSLRKDKFLDVDFRYHIKGANLERRYGTKVRDPKFQRIKDQVLKSKLIRTMYL